MKYNICINSKFNFDEFKNPLFKIVIDGITLETYNPIGIMPSIKINSIPVFFESILNEKDYLQAEYSCIIFGEHENDEGEVVIPENMVGFSIFDDRTIISKVDFFQLCLQMAEKAIEAVDLFKLKEKNIIDDEWIKSIKEVIPHIKEKINTLELN